MKIIAAVLAFTCLTVVAESVATKPAVPEAPLKVDDEKSLAAALKLLGESNDWRDHYNAWMGVWNYSISLRDDRAPKCLIGARKVLLKSDLPYDVYLLNRTNVELSNYRSDPKEPVHEFTMKADDLKLTLELDAAVYRPNEPIRMHIRFENTSDKYASVPLPTFGGRWAPLEGLGIVIKNLTTGKTIYETQSYKGRFVSGSYQFPQCETLEPHENFQQYVFFQSWFFSSLPTGDYSMEFSTDFAGIAQKVEGQGVIHRWTAPVVKFSIKGEQLKDPKEILTSAGKKFGIDDLPSELNDPAKGDHARAKFPWALAQLIADDDLVAYLQKTYPDHKTLKKSHVGH